MVGSELVETQRVLEEKRLSFRERIKKYKSFYGCLIMSQLRKVVL